MRIIFIFIFFVALSSCGGGGGSATSAISNAITGVAIDGYLYKATVCIDLNDNGLCDAGEPTSITDSNGGFSLAVTQEQANNHSVIVKAIAGTTIDQDSPNAALTSNMTLTAPVGNPSVISPLTTLIQAKVSAGQTLSASITAVQNELGLTAINPMKNYVAEKTTNSDYVNAHKLAASVAEAIKNNETNSDSSTSLVEKLTTLTGVVTAQIAPNVATIKAASSVSDAAASSKAVISDIPKVLYADTYGDGITAGVGSLRTGAVAHLIFAFDQLMNVSGGTPTLTLSSGGVATYAGGSGLNTFGNGSTKGTLIFDYTVGASDESEKLTSTGLNLNGSKILNANGNPAKASSFKTDLTVGTLRINADKISNPTRIIAFGDAYSAVDASGAGTFTVQTSETDNTVAGRIAAKYGIVLNGIKAAPLASTGGFSYANGALNSGKVSNVQTQINNFLSNVSNSVGAKDLIIITAGSQDIYYAAPTNNTSAISTAATNLTSSIQSLTNAGAKYILVVLPINMGRTPWGLSGVDATSATVQSLSYDTGTQCLSFSCQLSTKLNTAYPATSGHQPILLADLMAYSNLFTGTTTTGSADTYLSYGVTNPNSAACNAGSTSGCTTGAANANYGTYVFADNLNLTPLGNRLLADYIFNFSFNRAGWR